MNPLCSPTALPGAVLPPGFCALNLPVSVTWPRGLQALQTNTSSDLLVLEEGSQSVVLLEDTDGDFLPDSKRILVKAPGINHGLVVHNNYIYASSPDTVYRWEFDGYFNILDEGSGTVVINNIDQDSKGRNPGGHWTRTLIFDDQDRLYVSVGSNANVDPDSFRSRIRRFDLQQYNTEEGFPIDFVTGEIFADGLRNEVGLAWDKFGLLWGVENGPDSLWRKDLGGDITDDNPAEELHRFTPNVVGKHFGYPYCWSEYKLDPKIALGRGTQWAWPGKTSKRSMTDKDCRDTNRVKQPQLAMQAHSAPLGMTFYNYKDPSQLPEGCSGTFPKEMDGFLFLAFHGSWNRQVPTGYKVVFVPMDPTTGDVMNPNADPIDLLAHEAPKAKWPDGFRPVDVDFDGCGRLLVTSDGSGAGSKVVRIEWGSNENNPTSSSFFCSLTDCSKTSNPCCDGMVCRPTKKKKKKKKSGTKRQSNRSMKCVSCGSEGAACRKKKECCSNLCTNNVCA